MQSLTNDVYENIELQLKKEQAEFKTDVPQSFLLEMREIIEFAFLTPKQKKECFITREKTLTKLLQLWQRNKKKFSASNNMFSNVRYLAVFDPETKEVGKINSLNLLDQTIEFHTYSDKINGRLNRIKSFKDLSLFDYNTLQLGVVYKDYVSGNGANALSYIDMYQFLNNKHFVTKEVTRDEIDLVKGYGIEITHAEEHPVMKQVMLEYQIPEEIVAKPKRKLHKLDPNTMDILEEFESVKSAAETLNISASTISNVLCQGGSALNYLEAGGFRWQYSNIANAKYA